MSDKFKVVDDIKKLSKFLKGLAEFGDQLESMGSLEQAEQETKNRLAKLQADEAALKESIEKLTIDESIQQGKLMVEYSDAKAAHENMIVDAEAKASEILSSAKSDAESIVAAGNNQLKQLEIQMAGLKSEIASAGLQLAAENEKLEEVKLAIKKITGAV